MEKEIPIENDENYKKLFKEIKALIENSPLKDALMHEDDSFFDELDDEQEMLIEG